MTTTETAEYWAIHNYLVSFPMWMWVGGMFTVLSHCCMDPQSFMGQCNPLKAQGALELQKKGQFFRIFPVHIAILLVRNIHHSTGVGVGFGGNKQTQTKPKFQWQLETLSFMGKLFTSYFLSSKGEVPLYPYDITYYRVSAEWRGGENINWLNKWT